MSDITITIDTAVLDEYLDNLICEIEVTDWGDSTEDEVKEIATAKVCAFMKNNEWYKIRSNHD